MCNWNCQCNDCVAEDTVLENALARMEQGFVNPNETQVLPLATTLPMDIVEWEIHETQLEWKREGKTVVERIHDTALLYYTLTGRKD